MGYMFDLLTNELPLTLSCNPPAGKRHFFTAYRIKGTGGGTVTMAMAGRAIEPSELGDDE
jgi:hypothetical protein